jgi:hypothetical protein
MPASGFNEGIHVLEEFSCEAIPHSEAAKPNSAALGVNADVNVLAELLVPNSNHSITQERIAAFKAMSNAELLALVHSSGSSLSGDELLIIHDIATER